ncbi:hypothetical protein K1T71_015181 [Dendrolimus kikuchii]|nr:hypothetical protein K1T71_015181 [Dendrolimus kikuchii]
MNARLAFAIVSSTCWSAFQHGYNTGVLNAPQLMALMISQNISLKMEMKKLIFVKTTSDPAWFGRKGGLLWNNVLVFIAAVLQGASYYAKSAEMLIVGRLFIGINSGLNAGLAPLYLSEISPVSLRGSYILFQLYLIIEKVVWLGLESILGTPDGWPWLLSVTAVPAVIQLFTLPFCPESPKYLLLNRGMESYALRALNWLRDKVAVHEEMEEMRQEADKNKVTKKVTLRELFGKRTLRQPLFIAMVVMVAQQFSGINAVIFFSTDIFNKVNLNEAQAQYATLGMGAMNVVMTIVSLFLVEIAGRKTLLLIGFSSMLACTISLTVANLYSEAHVWVSYLCIALVILFVVGFAVGPGSIPWFLVTELFNQNSRPAASAVAVTINWTANFIVGLSFLPLSLQLGPNVFIIFAVLQFLFIVFIFLKVPETKNKTIEEITAMFRQTM